MVLTHELKLWVKMSLTTLVLLEFKLPNNSIKVDDLSWIKKLMRFEAPMEYILSRLSKIREQVAYQGK